MAKEIQLSRSSPTSLWLRIVSWFFKLSGLLLALSALAGLTGKVMRLLPTAGYPSYWFSLLEVSALAIILLAIGILLARQSRVGALLALAVALCPLGFVIGGARPLDWSDAIVTLITLAVIASIWPQLSWRMQRNLGK
jgi:hypothetical protein